MAIYLLEHKLYDADPKKTGWKLKRRFTKYGEACDLWSKLSGMRNCCHPLIIYRVVKLM